MRTVVTGGAGFLGSALVDRLLAEGHSVDVVDDLSTGSLANLAEGRAHPRHQLSFHQLDIRHEDLSAVFGRRRPEVVFHLANRAASADLVAAAEVAVVGSLRVLEAARGCGAAKVVYASSADLYAPAGPRQLPVRESHPQRPWTPAAAADRAVVDYLEIWRGAHDLEFTALAMADVYGPRQAPNNGVVAAVISAVLAGEAPGFPGDGRQTRDLLFVDDAVDALARAATRGSGLLLNVGTGVETSLLELCGVIAGTAGVTAPTPVPGPQWDGPRRLALDPAKASLHLGWEPWTTLVDGAAATVGWWRANRG